MPRSGFAPELNALRAFMLLLHHRGSVHQPRFERGASCTSSRLSSGLIYWCDAPRENRTPMMASLNHSDLSEPHPTIERWAHKPPARFEHAASALEVRHSVRLSYGGKCVCRESNPSSCLEGSHATITSQTQMEAAGFAPANG